MRVVIAGGHGQVARRLHPLLVARGDEPVGVVRNPAHVPDVRALGADAVVLDLERASVTELARVLDGADAVVFAAGAGPGSGPARKLTVDRDAARLLADAAELAGVRRYVLISAMNVEQADPASRDVFQVYLGAKAAAEADLRARDLDWTIVRPGRLTDSPATGRLRAGAGLGRADVPRADVAAVVAEALHDDGLAGVQFDLTEGETPMPEALAPLWRN